MNPKEKLIEKLFASECTEEELQRLFDLIKNDPNDTAPEVMTELFSQIEAANLPIKAVVSDRIYNTVEKAIALESTEEARVKSNRPNVFSLRSWGSIAAALALLLIASLVIVQYNKTSEVILRTQAGQQQKVELPDGSQVVLNANSSLAYNDSWDDEKDRIVRLEGEAFFKVSKNLEKEQKFKVITKDLTVEVLGTVFNVNSHQQETKVFLEEGKVKLDLNGMEESLMMKPGEIASYSEVTKAPVIAHTDAPNIETSWKDGLLLFEDSTLDKVVERIEEVYGITILVQDSSIFDRAITTGIPADNLEESIAILNATINLNIEKRGEEFIVE